MKFLLTASHNNIYTLIVEAESSESAVQIGWNTSKDQWEFESVNEYYDDSDWFVSSVTPIVENE
jgi:hypothetical protein